MYNKIVTFVREDKAVKIKYKNLEAEMKAEDIAEKIIDNNEKNWQEKLTAKTTAKKEILELKQQNKIENQLIKKMNDKDVKRYYKEKNKNLNGEENQDLALEKSKKIYKVLSIIMFFIYSLFCILGFQNHHIIAPIISLCQLLLTGISFLITMEFFHLFKNDYKLFFTISILLIVLWLAFAV